MDPIIQTTDLGRAFPVVGSEPFWALKNLSISIPEGKLTILRGKSGSGKTTLMNILSALDRPTTGSVFFDGIDLNAQTDTALGQLRRKNVGFVFQSVALIPVMNAYENVDFALRLAGSKKDNRKRAEECLKIVGLGGRMMHMPQELSGGERDTTDNRMELTAAIEGLSALNEPCAVELYSDSKYLVDGMTKGWAKSWRAKGWIKSDKKPALNPDLWERLLTLCETHSVTFIWVKGHAENPYNNRCDRLAVEYRKRFE